MRGIIAALYLLTVFCPPAAANIPPDRDVLGSIYDDSGPTPLEDLGRLLGGKDRAVSGLPGFPGGKELQGGPAEEGWVLDEPDPGAPPGGGTPGESPSRPDELRFWDKLQQKAFDDICRHIKLPLGTDLDLGRYGAVGADIERSFRRYPNKELALVDQIKLKTRLGYSRKVFSVKDVPVTLGLSAGAEGTAYVIRPLGAERACGELKRIVNPMTFKTVVPVKAERIGKMAVGELWKLPLVLYASASPGVSIPIAPMVTVSLSAGGSRQRIASVTLYRLSKDSLRFRLRIDRVNVTNQNGEVRYSFPFDEWAVTDGGDLFSRELDNQLERQLRRYLKLLLGAGRWTREGRKVLLEFIFDPRDPSQMEKVAEFLKGNISVLATLNKIATAAGDPFIRRDGQTDYLEKLERDYASKLDKDIEFAGIDDYDHEGKRFWFTLPILYDHESRSGEQTDEIVAGDKSSRLLVHRAWKRRESAFFDIPFLGQMVKKNTQTTVQTFVELDDKGFPEAPMMTYLRQEGFIRHSELSARDMVKKANDIMKYAGVRGAGTNRKYALPIDDIFPKPEEEEDPFDGTTRTAAKTYRSAVTAFTVIFNRDAVTDILWARPETIIKSYFNSLSDREDREVMRTVLKHSTVSEDGELRIDRSAVRRIYPYDYSSDQESVWDTIRTASERAARLARRILEARKGDWGERTKALLRIVADPGSGGPSYDDVMKVLIQLVDPKDVFAEFTVRTNKKVKGEEDVNSRYLLHEKNNDPLLRERTRLKERFSEPSLLVD